MVVLVVVIVAVAVTAAGSNDIFKNKWRNNYNIDNKLD
jgi:hypothetical protein